MFWDTHAMAAGAKLAEEHLGPQGRYHPTQDPTHISVGLYTHEAAKFWYGDIDLPAEEDKLKKIAEGLKATLFVIPDSTADDGRPFHERALFEVAV